MPLRPRKSSILRVPDAAPDAPNPFVSLLQRAKPEVDLRLDELFERQMQATRQLGPEVAAILGAARDLSLRGGKRMRAALVLAGQSAFAAPENRQRKAAWRQGVDAGVAIEMLQTYFLIHDDWMDQDAERRGGPSVHSALAREFSTPHIADCGALLAGDYLVALASQHLLRTVRTHPQVTELMDRFAELQLCAVLGQQLDIVGRCKDAELIYKLKTSSYSVSGPLELGALLAGASPKRARAVASFGDPVGIAFQLRDDLLGVFADEKETGKPFASDIRAGKWTWVVQYALKNGNLSERTALNDCLGKPKASVRALKAAVDALRSSGAQLATEKRIDEHTRSAMKALKRLRLHEGGESLLSGAARVLTHRDR